MIARMRPLLFLAAAVVVLPPATLIAEGVPGWVKGKGWGNIWGPNDEVGALNALKTAHVLKALQSVKEGKVYDLGLAYNRTSYKWPGHSPGEILSFRTPEGVKRQKDLDFTYPEKNPGGMAWHSSALFVNDNIATQIDGLGHITVGTDNHWYNGFKEEDWGGNWGIRKCDAAGIPPIIARGVLIDVAGQKKVDALPAGTAITIQDLVVALAEQGTEIQVGDVVLIRTGTARHWGESGSDHEKIRAHDSAGINLASAKWLVEEKGAILIGSDTSGLEVMPPPEGSPVFNPVHEYLLVQQGVHIGEFHNSEELARDRVYEFCYICTTSKIRGTAAGFCLRPLAIK